MFRKWKENIYFQESGKVYLSLKFKVSYKSKID